MQTLYITILHRNIGLRFDTILFSQLIVSGLLDHIIHLWCPNMHHASSYLGALGCTDLLS